MQNSSAFKLWCLFRFMQVIRNLHTAFGDRLDLLEMVVRLSQNFETLYKNEVGYSYLSL
jgi:hypothetical protein